MDSPDVYRSTPPCLTRQAGAGLIEFSVVAVPVLLIGLGSVEIAQWFYVKQAVSLALLEAARAGITQHARPEAIESAFERALWPLYTSGGARSAEQRMRLAFTQRTEKTGEPPWQIELLGPSSHAFHDFADPQIPLAAQTGRPAINNDYQQEQDKRYRAKGWDQGVGPQSKGTIYDANTLVLQATYLHEPLLPGVRGLMRALNLQPGSYAGRAMARGGYLPIVQKVALTMQSHPVQWPSLGSGKVITSEGYAGAPAPRAIEPCHGLWCLEGYAASRDTDRGSVGDPANGRDPGASPSDQDASAPDGDQPAVVSGNDGPVNPPVDTVSPGFDVQPDDPACGTTLCCLAP